MNARLRIAAGALAMAGLSALAVRAQAPAGKTIKDGVYTVAQANRGRAVYDDRCAWCHGASLGGKDMSPAVARYEFDAKWNGTTVFDLAERMRLTMPFDDPGTMTAQENIDVLAYMLSVGNYPAGQTELPTQSVLLRMIRYEPAY